MIIFGKDCKTLMASFFNRGVFKKIYLPSDFCYSTVKKFKNYKIFFNFYQVMRNFKSKDQYYFPKNDTDSLFVISDLFNFRQINYVSIKNKKIFLDLAHCSLDTARYYLKKIDNRKIVGICISFGKGKYYDLGGGGIIFDCKDINKINIKRDEITLGSIPNKVLSKGIYNRYSTRIILEQNTIKSNEILKLKSKGYHISDGLFDHITKTYDNSKYFWKNCY